MIALEMAKFIEVEKVILISSALTPQAIPPYFKMMSKLKIQRWVSPSTMKRPNELLYWLFGISQREHKNLLASIMNDTDVSFFLWAIESIMLWKGKSCTGAVIQVHRTKDRILNFKTADYAIAGGGHLMIITKAREVSDILKQVLV